MKYSYAKQIAAAQYIATGLRDGVSFINNGKNSSRERATSVVLHVFGFGSSVSSIQKKGGEHLGEKKVSQNKKKGEIRENHGNKGALRGEKKPMD